MSFWHEAGQLKRWIVQHMMPHLCLGCHKPVDSCGFCGSCWMNLTFLTQPLCLLCGTPSVHNMPVVCRHCKKWVPLWNSHRALWQYGPLSRRVIFAFKHGRHQWIGHFLARLLQPLVLTTPADLIVPVPLHRKKLAHRGFNQTFVLARALEKLTGIPVANNILQRITPTVSQGRHTPEKRKQHTWGAFALTSTAPAQLAGKTVILLDDVFTTGATLHACTDCLRQTDIAQIHAITVAKVL